MNNKASLVVSNLISNFWPYTSLQLVTVIVQFTLKVLNFTLLFEMKNAFIVKKVCLSGPTHD